MNFQPFAAQKYLNLETFKKSGAGVRTPIWFAADPAKSLDSADAKLYVYTNAETGKVRRIRTNGHVRIAPCDLRGNVSGQWMDARAVIVGGVDASYAMQLLNRKYFPLKQLLDFFSMFRRRERVIIAILPA